MVNAKLNKEQKFEILFSCFRGFHGSRYSALNNARRSCPTDALRGLNRPRFDPFRSIRDQRVA